jgi:hypothetical protein
MAEGDRDTDQAGRTRAKRCPRPADRADPLSGNDGRATAGVRSSTNDATNVADIGEDAGDEASSHDGSRRPKATRSRRAPTRGPGARQLQADHEILQFVEPVPVREGSWRSSSRATRRNENKRGSTCSSGCSTQENGRQQASRQREAGQKVGRERAPQHAAQES